VPTRGSAYRQQCRYHVDVLLDRVGYRLGDGRIDARTAEFSSEITGESVNAFDARDQELVWGAEPRMRRA
jgi:hypothetical protein